MTYEIKQFDYTSGKQPAWRARVDTLEDAEEAIRAHLQTRIDAERAHVWETIDNEYIHNIAERTLEEVIREETEILATWQVEASSPHTAMTEPVGDLEDVAADLELDAEAAYFFTEGAGSYIVQDVRSEAERYIAAMADFEADPTRGIPGDGEDWWSVAEDTATIDYEATDERYPGNDGVVFEDGSGAGFHPAHHQRWIYEPSR